MWSICFLLAVWRNEWRVQRPKNAFTNITSFQHLAIKNSSKKMFLCIERRNYKKPLVWITEISIISVATFQRSDRVNVLIWSLWLCKYCYCDCYLIHSWPYNLTGGCFSPLICFPSAMKTLKEVATDFHVNRNCFSTTVRRNQPTSSVPGSRFTCCNFICSCFPWR